jgi:hypothetical protein
MQAVVAGMKRQMDWQKLLTSLVASVDVELWLRNVYLDLENYTLAQQIDGREPCCQSSRRVFAAIGQTLRKKAGARRDDRQVLC